MDTIEARRRARSRLVRSLDEIAGTLTPAYPKLLSLDVFDTVLTRACGRPSDLFLWLGRRLAIQGNIDCTPEVFAYARARAEQAVWQREGGLDSHAGLTEFYTEVTQRLHLDEAMVPDLVAAELALETEGLRAVPAAHRLLDSCQDLDVPVVFTSDTYFSSEFLEAELRRLGLQRSNSHCRVSSEAAMSKVSGRLFKNMISPERPLEEILHVGDHPHSDVAAPRMLGISSRWCVAARLNKYEELLSNAAPATGGLAASLAGASRLARLEMEPRNQREAAICDVAAGVAAPALVGYVLWILKRARELSLRRLVFLARDGQVLCEMARRLAEKLGFQIDVRYLYVSRRSTNLAATFEADEEEVGWVFRDISELTAAEFLERFDLQWSDVSEILGTAEGQSEPRLASQISEPFRDGLSQGPIRDLVLDRAAARRKVVLDYFEQEGLLDDVPQAIIDFGGVGSQVRAIHALVAQATGRPPHIFMIGLDKPEDAGLSRPELEPDWTFQTETYLYDHRRNRGIKRSRGFGTCVQMFCAADHGTVTGYSYNEGSVVPELDGQIDETMIGWGIELFRSTVYSFVDNLTLDDDLVDPYADIRGLTCEVINEFWTAPHRDEAAAWGNFPFEGAQAVSSVRRPLAYRYTIRSIGQEIASGRFPNLGWQHWYEGSLALSSPAIRILLKQAEKAYQRSESGNSRLHSMLASGIRKLAGR